MANQIHLRLNNSTDGDEPNACWIRVRDGHVVGNLTQGTLQQVRDSLEQEELVVYVPGLDVLMTQVSLPAGRRSQLLTALPYVLEDNLVDEVDDLHCVLGPRLENGAYVAAVVKIDAMEKWLAVFQQAGLHPRQLLPDTLLLPWQAESWTVHCQAQQAWVRNGAQQGFATSANLLPILLQQSYQIADPKPDTIRLSYCDEVDRTALKTALPDVELIAISETENVSPIDPLLSLLQQHGVQSNSLNLLQGEYAPQSRIKQQLRPWRTTAILAAVWLVIGVLASIVEFYTLDKQNALLEQQMAKVYKQTFPAAKLKAKENIYKRMTSDLTRMRGGGANTGPGFSQLISQLAPVAAKHKKAHFTQFRYRNGKMELLLEINDLQSLDALKQSLSEATDWDVEIKSANSTDNKVQGRIVISRPS